MKKIIYIASVFVLMGLLLQSCPETTTPSTETKQIFRAGIQNVPGFIWFESMYDFYTPKQNIIDEIKENFSAENHKFVLFCKPTCISCDTAVKLFAFAVKVLEESLISEDYFEMYSINHINKEHPYKEILQLKVLPAMFVFKNGEPVYSVLDFYLEATEKLTVEEYILEGLKQ